MHINKLSSLQNEIIYTFESNNILITGYPGTGKTTTGIFIAKKFYNKKILFLSLHNNSNQIIKERLKKYNLKNVDAYTLKNYNDIFQTINQINYDFIIVDETEDFTKEQYILFWKCFSTLKTIPNICLIGDINQSWSLSNCEENYIKFADNLFNINKNKWKKFKLTKSYAINKNTANFLNNVIFNEEKIDSNMHQNNKVEYIIANSWNSKLVIKKIKSAIKKYGINHILLLTPSIEKSNIPIWGILDKIININKCYIPENDYEHVLSTSIKNKLCILNYTQSKNIYRKIVFLFNFDMSYYDFKNDSNNPHNIYKDIYLATTRATKSLNIIHDFKNEKLNYLKNENIAKFAKLKIDNHNIKKNISKNIIWNNNINSTKSIINNNNLKLKNEYIINDLVNYLSNEMIEKLRTAIIITKEKIDNDIDFSNYISKIKVNDNKWVNISEITNEALIYNYQKIYNPDSENILDKIVYQLKENLNWIKKNRPIIFEKKDLIININDQKNISLENSLIISNLWNYYLTGNDYKLKNISINIYNWLSYNDLGQAFKVINKNLSSNLLFKYKIFKNDLIDLPNIKLTGYIDCIDLQKNTIWNFVFVNNIDDLQFVKIAFFAYIIQDNENWLFNIIKESIKMKLKSKEINYTNDLKNINFKFNILNIKTNEIYYLEINIEEFKKHISEMFKFDNIYEKDKMFIQNNNNIKELYKQ